jgi:hypothetical protein
MVAVAALVVHGRGLHQGGLHQVYRTTQGGSALEYLRMNMWHTSGQLTSLSKASSELREQGAAER